MASARACTGEAPRRCRQVGPGVDIGDAAIRLFHWKGAEQGYVYLIAGGVLMQQGAQGTGPPPKEQAPDDPQPGS